MIAYVIKSKHGYAAGQIMPWWVEEVSGAILFPERKLALRHMDAGDEIVEVAVGLRLGVGAVNIDDDYDDADDDDGNLIKTTVKVVNAPAKSKTRHNRSLKEKMDR
jgi:hypothetical protein